MCVSTGSPTQRTSKVDGQYTFFVAVGLSGLISISDLVVDKKGESWIGEIIHLEWHPRNFPPPLLPSPLRKLISSRLSPLCRRQRWNCRRWMSSSCVDSSSSRSGSIAIWQPWTGRSRVFSDLFNSYVEPIVMSRIDKSISSFLLLDLLDETISCRVRGFEFRLQIRLSLSLVIQQLFAHPDGKGRRR